LGWKDIGVRKSELVVKITYFGNLGFMIFWKLGAFSFHIFFFFIGRFVSIICFNCEHCIHCKTKTNKNLVDFQNFQKSNFVRGKFLKIWSSINLPWGQARPQNKFGSIGSAVLTFTGYKQTNKICLKPIFKKLSILFYVFLRSK